MKSLAELKKDTDGLVSVYLEKVEKASTERNIKNLDASSAALKKLQKHIDDMNLASVNEAYEKFNAEDNPMYAAIKTGYITQFKEKVKVKDGKVTCEIVEHDRPVDVIAFSDKAKSHACDITVMSRISDCFFIMGAQAALDADKTVEQYYNACREAKRFKTVEITLDQLNGMVANNAITVAARQNAIQKAVDAILFEDNGKGENKYLVKRADVKRVQRAVTRLGQKGVDKLNNNRQMLGVIVQAIYMNLNGKDYELIIDKDVTI